MVAPMQVPPPTERTTAGSPATPVPMSTAAGTAVGTVPTPGSAVCTSTSGTVLNAGSTLTVRPSGSVSCPLPPAALDTKFEQLTELLANPLRTVVRIRFGSRISLLPCPDTPAAKAVKMPSPGGDSEHCEEPPVPSATLLICVPALLTVPRMTKYTWLSSDMHVVLPIAQLGWAPAKVRTSASSASPNAASISRTRIRPTLRIWLPGAPASKLHHANRWVRHLQVGMADASPAFHPRPLSRVPQWKTIRQQEIATNAESSDFDDRMADLTSPPHIQLRFRRTRVKLPPARLERAAPGLGRPPTVSRRITPRHRRRKLRNFLVATCAHASSRRLSAVAAW